MKILAMINGWEKWVDVDDSLANREVIEIAIHPPLPETPKFTAPNKDSKVEVFRLFRKGNYKGWPVYSNK